MYKMIKIYTATDEGVQRKANNYLILYNLRAAVKVEHNGIQQIVGEKELYFINPEDEYRVTLNKQNVAILLEIDYRKLLQLTNYKKYDFHYQISEELSSYDTQLYFYIEQLIQAEVNEEESLMTSMKFSLSLVELLLNHYSIVRLVSNDEDEKKSKIQAYIAANIKENLTLAQIAERFEVTPQYFSKYFKSLFGQSFLKYMNQQKVALVKQALIESDTPLIQIAFDCGFSNLSSFNRIFKEFEQMNPGEYRKLHQANTELQKIDDSIVDLLKKESVIVDNVYPVTIDMQKENWELLDDYWFSILNLGSIQDILYSENREQIACLKKELGFKSARLELDNGLENFDYTFYQEAKVFDFLYEQGFHIILVVDYRYLQIQPLFFKYFEKMLNFFTHRYGINNINRWQIELAYQTHFNREKSKEYAMIRKKLAALMTKLHLELKILGPGLYVDKQNISLKEFLRYNGEMDCITITVAPYAIVENNNQLQLTQLNTDFYAIDQYHLAKSILGQRKLLVTSWKETIDVTNSLFDTLYRGSNILKVLFKGYGYLRSLPLDKPLDLMYNQIKRSQFFEGLPGIINIHGLRKPAYLALSFMKKLDKYFVYRDDHVFITHSQGRFFQIVCHNNKQLKFSSYDKRLNDMTLINYFEDLDELHIHLKIQNVPNGVYFVKTRRVNANHGNVYKSYQQMTFSNSSFFGPDEMNYLKSCTVPAIKGETVEVINQVMDLDIYLDPNEFKHLHILFSQN